MAEPSVLQPPTLTPTASAPAPHRRQRHRRPRGQGGATPQQQNGNPPAERRPVGDDNTQVPQTPNALALRPASVAPGSSTNGSRPGGSNTRRGTTSGRGGRGNESGKRSTRGTGTMMPSGRRFGGQLTVEGSNTPAGSNLQPGAAEFVPGQSHTQRSQRGGAAFIQRPRKGSKSSAPDLTTRLHEDIEYGVYECAICTNEISRHSKVWSCKTCWTVFHLGCIKKWSKNEGSTVTQQQSSDGLQPPRMWRCPGCNLPKDTLPSTYSCWCGKETDPRPIPGLPPHSCGQTCSKSRLQPKKCPHPCELICHAGPCPPCSHMGPTQPCFCGKQSATKRCTETDYDKGWSCGQICGDIMPCGEHFCERECHEGLCGACEVRVDARCYCGQVEKPIICCEKSEELHSGRRLGADNAEVDEWLGVFNCGNLCQRPFDCDVHKCQKECHVQDLGPTHCPRSPDIVSHCPCGKTKLEEITNKVRVTCEDPIPNCDKKCLKLLACGHQCQMVCHSGECMPCLQTVPILCRCGRTTSMTICHQGVDEPPQCLRICRVTLNCGRHECGERCCTGERKAFERQAARKKMRRLDSPPRITEDGFEAEHICTRPCGRPLKCGNHTCQEPCHKGPCGACREAIFDEISCNCGRTVLQPPLPCGTRPPPCRFECNRPKDCGHPQVPHNCHGDEEACPKCPFLTEKACLCGKKTLRNQQCWLQEVRCGEVCGKKLRCGSHRCLKLCHRPGECEDSHGPCMQPCGKPKKVCGHPDEEICHAPYPCKEEKPCTHKILITCSCQHLKQDLLCKASKKSEGNTKKTIKCDEECARLERNRKLALALNVDPESHKDDNIPYSAETLSLYRENVKWAQVQEREFRVFAADPEEKRLRFKPMPAHQRAFLHSLAEDFGFDSESMDPEPHRHVAIFKTPRFVTAPTKTLGECIKIRAATETNQTRAHASNVADDPFNGFVLTNPRFALTIEELRSEFSGALDPLAKAGITLDIAFLPNEEIVLKARPSNPSITLADKATEATLKNLKVSLAKLIAVKSTASSIQLCRLDDFLNILRRETSGGTTGDGWSQVAAKAAAPRRVLPGTGLGTKSVYTVLGSRLAEAKAKKEEALRLKNASKAAVVDDWEAAEMQAEEEEKVAGAGSGGEDAEVDGPAAQEQEFPDEKTESKGLELEHGGERADSGTQEVQIVA